MQSPTQPDESSPAARGRAHRHIDCCAESAPAPDADEAARAAPAPRAAPAERRRDGRRDDRTISTRVRAPRR